MSFLDILFNVVAFAWSPVAIIIYAFIIVCIIGNTADAEFSFGETGFGWVLSVINFVIIILGVTFAIWVLATEINPLGWHYPLGYNTPM